MVAPLPKPPSTPATEPQAVALGPSAVSVVGPLLAVILATTLARLVVFPFAENFYGDAVARADLAERWAGEPHVIRGFDDGARQFGPLHIYVMGAVLSVWDNRETASRLVSLLFGILAVIPLFRLVQRLFDRRAAVLASLAFAAWPLHIQASTTAGSEALFLFLFLACLDVLFQGLEARRFRLLLAAALLLNLACATRYDAWLYIPILSAVVAVWGSDRIAAATRAVIFGAACCVFPLYWMQLNEVSMGDPLYPVHFIESFHRQWAQSEAGWLGQVGFRVYALGFWPGATLITLSPLVGIACLTGMARAFRVREKRTLAVLALLPVAYYAVRGSIFMTFAPLSRFFVAHIALALPYLASGFDFLFGRFAAGVRRAAGVLTVALAVASPLLIGWTTAWKDGRDANSLRPISPLSTLPVDQMTVARWVKAQAAKDDVVMIDQDASYDDLNLAFYSGRPETMLIRRRWEDFEKNLGKHLPTWVIVMSEGRLAKTDGIDVADDHLDLRGHPYEVAFRLGTRFRVYRSSLIAPARHE